MAALAATITDTGTGTADNQKFRDAMQACMKELAERGIVASISIA